jgi:hypothetical protein
MIGVGLVGEDPHDTTAVKNLLNKKYSGRVHFVTLAKNVTGSNLDSNRIKKILQAEFDSKKHKFIVYIRDLDGFKSEENKISKMQSWFKALDKQLHGNGILLLNIWEIEALILADIAAFNKHYKTSLQFGANPMFKEKPKEFLMKHTYKGNKQYRESDCPELFKQLDFDKVVSKCAFFKEFIEQFDEKLNTPRVKK